LPFLHGRRKLTADDMKKIDSAANRA
jgi:hypothetical protein